MGHRRAHPPPRVQGRVGVRPPAACPICGSATRCGLTTVSGHGRGVVPLRLTRLDRDSQCFVSPSLSREQDPHVAPFPTDVLAKGAWGLSPPPPPPSLLWLCPSLPVVLTVSRPAPPPRPPHTDRPHLTSQGEGCVCASKAEAVRRLVFPGVHMCVPFEGGIPEFCLTTRHLRGGGFVTACAARCAELVSTNTHVPVHESPFGGGGGLRTPTPHPPPPLSDWAKFSSGAFSTSQFRPKTNNSGSPGGGGSPAQPPPPPTKGKLWGVLRVATPVQPGGESFHPARVGRLSLCAQALPLPLGVPPTPAPAMLHTHDKEVRRVPHHHI